MQYFLNKITIQTALLLHKNNKAQGFLNTTICVVNMQILIIQIFSVTGIMKSAIKKSAAGRWAGIFCVYFDW